MDVKQAVGLLQHHINTWKGKFPSGHFEACEFAIKELGKQIPRQVNEIEIRYENILYGYCPNCDQFVMGSKMHCSECGQKLNWKVDDYE